MNVLGEILQSSQKDELYIDKLRESVSGLVLDVAGPQRWNTKEKWIAPIVRSIYYSLTTLSDYQTLGEEYSGLVQTNAHLTLPSKLARIIFILAKSFGTTCIDHILDKIQREDVSGEKEKQIRTFRRFLQIFESVHTCLFYYQGLYYELARRLTGLRYVKVGPQSHHDKSGFRILGHVATLQLFLNIGLGIYKLLKEQNKTSLSESVDIGLSSGVVSSETCSLCLEPLGSRGRPAATSCGHLGCWVCLLEASSITGECPLCRAVCLPNSIIPLQNL